MPKNDADLILEEGCFANSSLTKILCNTQEQMDNIKKQLKNSGKEDIVVEFVGTTENGYKYSAETVNGKACVTLLDVPEDLTEFDGTIPLDNDTSLNVTAIGNGALENKTSLKWVILPESVTEIGSQAFKGCSALQGLFIGAKDTVVLGDGFVDDCPSLRFAASNAMTAVIDSGYSPEMTDKDTMFLCPTNSVGYTDGFDSFTAESGIEWYEVVDGGETGKLLYGCSKARGEWLVIRCGTELDGEVSLPGDTVEIFSNAFYNTKAPSGEFEFTVIWFCGGCPKRKRCLPALNCPSGKLRFTADSAPFHSSTVFSKRKKAALRGITAVKTENANQKTEYAHELRKSGMAI